MTHTIRRKLTFPQAPETVRRALTNSEALAEWMYPNDFEPRVGHRFTFRVPPKPQLENGLVARCEVARGVLEMLSAVLLIVPAATMWMPVLPPIAAAVLAIEAPAISRVYAAHSLKLTAENPLIWSVVMPLLVTFVAYGRYAIKPLT